MYLDCECNRIWFFVEIVWELCVDLLLEVLLLLEMCDLFFIGLWVGGLWVVDLFLFDGIKFNVVVEGSCWLIVDGVGLFVWLCMGDCFLFVVLWVFLLVSDLLVVLVLVVDVYWYVECGIVYYGELVDCFLIGGCFVYEECMLLLFGSLLFVVIVSGDFELVVVLCWLL